MAREWSPEEEKTLTEVYPVGGAIPCSEKLPDRMLTAIYAKARTMGLKAPLVRSNGGKRFAKKYPDEPWIDTAIREGFAKARKRGDLTELSKRIDRPAHWVHRRARELGIGRAGTRLDDWSPTELEVLERYAPCRPYYIRNRLAIAGYKRSESAISNKLQRMKFDRHDPDRWSAEELGMLLGVAGSTITRWIERNGLPANQKKEKGHWTIERGPLRGWIAKNPAIIDLRRVDQPWFMDLVFGSIK